MTEKCFKFLYLLLLCIVFSPLIKSQSLKTNTYFLKSFGYVSIPIALDTLSQKIAKQAIIGNYFENASDSGISQVKHLFNVNMGKNTIASFDSTVTVFWPMKSLFALLNFDSERKLDTTFSIIPSIMFKKNISALHSSKFKSHFENKQKIGEFKQFIIDTYKKGLGLILPNTKINKINAEYFLYRNDYPCFKVSLVFALPDNDYKIQYSQDIYSLFRENSNYLFKFEFENSETNKWQLYELEFLKTLKIL